MPIRAENRTMATSPASGSRSRKRKETEMKMTFIATAALIGVASAAHAQGGFATRQNHDGIYAVDITTRRGDCDKAYHWLIDNGSLRPAQAGRPRGFGVR